MKVICFRDRYSQGQRFCKHSIVLHLELNAVDPKSLNQFVGWEKWKNQLRPRTVDMSSSMDPLKLSESAVDLNLKLMKWRLMPDLKLASFRDTKCLIIGAGTLGCNVARQLLAWGVRHITFVDNASVSLSNPVRQSLFVFSDATTVGRNKAIAASEALKSIFPGVKSQGVELSIPMPGHPVTPNFSQHYNKDSNESDVVDKVRKACQDLSELIRSHDVIFLLTDTRESRWLPSLLANIHGKLVINAALGFDTYLVMRHGLVAPGISPSFEDAGSIVARIGDTKISGKRSWKHIPGSKLGCYFCNDVVGPANSTLNRSMDQQCTVTRPGVSMIAAALSVELLICILQHSLGPSAPADSLSEPNVSAFVLAQGSLGIVPHQIRGFLSHFTQVLPATTAFSRCPACSQSVLDAYKKDGFEFLLRVFDDASFLEHISGLKELRNSVNFDDVLTLSDTE